MLSTRSILGCSVKGFHGNIIMVFLSLEEMGVLADARLSWLSYFTDLVLSRISMPRYQGTNEHLLDAAITPMLAMLDNT